MFFFFQAEDGIRDLTVTGVQTCALPISSSSTCRSSCSAVISCCRAAVRAASAYPAERNRVPSAAASGCRSREKGRGRRDRESVVEGKRVDLGGRRIIKKKKEQRISKNTR